MKGVIVYESRGGATAAYARWLSEATGFEAFPARKAGRLDGYDVVLLGSCVRMGKPTLGKWILAKWTTLSRAKTVLFTVAGASAADPLRDRWVREAIGELATAMPHFPLDGKMKFDDLPWLDRTLMRFGIKMTAKSDPEQAREMGREYDNVRKENLSPMLKHLEGMGVAIRKC